MMTNIECLIKACKATGTKYKVLDEHSNFLRIDTPEPVYFIQTKVPIQRSDFAQICKDKDYTYKVLADSVDMPFTKSYLDPFVAPQYDEYKRELSYREVVDNILREFPLPVILKKNKGSVGRNVFLCSSNSEVEEAVEVIFNQSSKDYDYLLLAQEGINVDSEYRVIVYNGRIKFAYLKDISDAKFVGNLSPLHWENSKAVLVNDSNLIYELQSIVDKVDSKLKLSWAGLDIAKDVDGRYWLIEINASPSFARYVEDNGDEKVVSVLSELLLDLRETD